MRIGERNEDNDKNTREKGKNAGNQDGNAGDGVGVIGMGRISVAIRGIWVGMLRIRVRIFV